MGIAMMRPTILIAALMVVTVVVFASTTNSVQSVNATQEILVSASVRLFANKILANMKRKITINFFQMMKVFRNYCNCQYTLVLGIPAGLCIHIFPRTLPVQMGYNAGFLLNFAFIKSRNNQDGSCTFVFKNHRSSLRNREDQRGLRIT